MTQWFDNAGDRAAFLPGDVDLIPWLYLVVAGVMEVIWAIGLKYTDGFSKLGPSVFTILTMIGSFFCLSQAVRTIPIGAGYAIWTGIGAAGTAILGVVLFAEPVTPTRVACLVLILAGVLGLKLAS
jgi:quaternary ammonium compound-resistance protein SugE